MMRVTVCVMALIAVFPSDGSAQAVPSPGDRIRIKQVDGTVLTGKLAATLSPETIQIFVDSSRVEVPVARIEVLETSLGKSSSSKNVAITMVVGGVVGAAFGALAWEPCTFLCISPFESETRSSAVYAGLAIGALVGLPVGFFIRSERWSPVALPASVASRLTIRPVIGRGVGLVGAFGIGGF